MSTHRRPKWIREQEKKRKQILKQAQKRAQQQLQKPKPAAAKAVQKNAQPKERLIRLRWVGGGWFPKISERAVAKLRNGDRVVTGNFVYTPVTELDSGVWGASPREAKPVGEKIRFVVSKELGMLKGMEFFGEFILDTQKATLTRIEERKY